MSDEEELPQPQAPPERPFAADRPKQGRARCKRCKAPCAAGELRVARLVPNHFNASGGYMKAWHHPRCLWEAFANQRATTKKIEDPEKDIEGWEDMVQEDMDVIVELLRSAGANVKTPKATRTAGNAKAGEGSTPKKRMPRKRKSDNETTPSSAQKKKKNEEADEEEQKKKKVEEQKHAPIGPRRDELFREFRRICLALSDEPSYLAKTALIRKLFTEGCEGDGFKGDLELWVRLLLPMVEKRVYNLQSKQLVKLFSRIFHTSEDDMLEDLEQGDVAETIRVFFETSKKVQPTKKSTVSLSDVDKFLDELSGMTREDEQTHHFTQMAKRCTTNDLKSIIRLIKHDLRINAGPKHVLEAVHPDAYAAFQASRDIRAVVRQTLGEDTESHGDAGAQVRSVESTTGSPTKKGALNIGVKLMTPVLPMLAEACKSVDQAMKKCPNGMYAEIKYDGERVQVHKRGTEFKYFSRALKPVLPHKVNHFKEYIPMAFPSGEDLILDSEVLCVDIKTGKPLPFGTLGKHKKSEYQDATVCLFVFDCIYYNGESLMQKSMKERREILGKVMTEIPNHVVFSDSEEITVPEELNGKMEMVFRLGLEGLVLKDLRGPYEPGKRHWLKVKKDYLFGGAMADTADLVVLGAWFGTGQKGGMMSIFLMGCYDPDSGRWCTVTKVHGGHDDETLKRLQTELKMEKISKDAMKIPSWLKANKSMYPDFIALNPKESPVWEITGAEFTQNEIHTADGISVRFPRVTRIRDDKAWEQATSLPELRALYIKSKETSNFTLKNMTEATESPSKLSRPKSSSPSKRMRNVSPGENSSKQASETSTVKDSEKRKQRKIDSFLRTHVREEQTGGPQKPLPDVFCGVRLSLPPDLPAADRFTLKRYFVGFGGALLNEEDSASATHVIQTEFKQSKADAQTGAARVNIQWLWDSIKRQKALDPLGYAS